MTAAGPARTRTRRLLLTAVGAGLAVGCAASAAASVPTAAGAPVGAAALVPVTLSADDAALSLAPVGTYATGVFDASAAEIVAFHPGSQRLFVVNAQAGLVEVLDASDPAAPAKVADVATAGTPSADGSVVPEGAVANSVAVRADGLGVVAVESPTKTDPGWLVLFDAAADVPVALGAVRVGALPDMVALDATGTLAVVANEGEPSDDYAVDPEGSVSVVALPRRVTAPEQDAVRTADFHAFEAPGALPAGVRVFGPAVDAARPVSADLEPEYVTISGTTAYVTLQEADAVAVVDLVTATVQEVLPLGWKDHGAAGAGLDPSDRDDAADVRTVPGLRGLYLPDAIASYTAAGSTYLVTANEGDAREWGDYVEGARVKDLGEDGLPPVCAGNPLALRTADEDLGRLEVSTASGLSADGSCYAELYAFGGRSFSIWGTDGTLVFDSGDALERITAEAMPEAFNTDHAATAFDDRSDTKGPEPEGVAIGTVSGRTYAFVGLERAGGVAVFDVTVPADAAFVTYVNNRDLSVSVEDDGEESLARAGDLGAEGVTFVPSYLSPTGAPALAVANEVSGTTTLFGITVAEPTASVAELRTAWRAYRAQGELRGPVAFLTGQDLAAAERFAARGFAAQADRELERFVGRLLAAVGSSTATPAAVADLADRATELRTTGTLVRTAG
ncbi:choice-of-anchor I family protein [Cellulomonas endophytica]|uniref:choice-of-anchor I family protein n=1 Tax=Cellulomonas endophytica TaxID=2494735 RepID=UPI00196A5C54|nr:choice-of-anchor I family protein [Cellulomonas endophytica]